MVQVGGIIMSSLATRLGLITVWLAIPVVLAFLSRWPAAAGRSDEKPPVDAAHLEFRIVANEIDDRDAIEAAEKYFAGTRKDSERQQELQQRARDGRLPPAPNPPNG